MTAIHLAHSEVSILPTGSSIGTEEAALEHNALAALKDALGAYVVADRHPVLQGVRGVCAKVPGALGWV